MFGWRRRNEGFEWKEYVRTTVLVRRADRQRRIDEVRVAAVDKVQHARDAGLEVGKAGLDFAADRAAFAAQSTGRGIGALLSFVWSRVRSGVSVAAAPLVGVAASITDRLPKLKPRRLPQRDNGRLAHRLGRNQAKPDVSRLVLPTRWIGAAVKGVVSVGAAAAVIVYGGQMLRGDGLLDSTPTTVAPSQTTLSTLASALIPASLKFEEPLTGRASVISGSLLKVGSTSVQLDGVLAPDAMQPCLTERGKRWNCGQAAKRALERFVKGKSVTCETVKRKDASFIIGQCVTASDDLARVLVRDGHVFSSADGSTDYSPDEAAAKTERLGVWQGANVRPDEWRLRSWEEAKRSAPDGCPIKGFVKADARVYEMPWSESYNSTRRRDGKADRWFCSEDEAQAAGFRAASLY